MSKPIPTDPDIQRTRFAEAVELLGGFRATARLLDVSEHTIRALVKGQRRLHDGFLRDIAAALITHADQCRALERRISPAFAGNLTADQLARPPHPNRYDRKDRNDG
jgi:plasmid maintenance system antidote protein VapI